MNQSPVASSQVGWLGIVVFILIIDALQYLLILTSNMLKDMMYTSFPWYSLRLFFPHNVYDISFYHPLITFGILCIMGFMSNPMHKLIAAVRVAITNYLTITPVVNDANNPRRADGFREKLLNLGWSRDTYVFLPA